MARGRAGPASTAADQRTERPADRKDRGRIAARVSGSGARARTVSRRWVASALWSATRLLAAATRLAWSCWRAAVRLWTARPRFACISWRAAMRSLTRTARLACICWRAARLSPEPNGWPEPAVASGRAIVDLGRTIDALLMARLHLSGALNALLWRGCLCATRSARCGRACMTRCSRGAAVRIELTRFRARRAWRHGRRADVVAAERRRAGHRHVRQDPQ